MKKKIFMMAAVISSIHLQAQDTTKTLDEIVLTANKYPQKQSETGKVITIVNKDQLAKSGGKTITEILNQLTGVSVNGSNNNLGTNQTVNTRGGASGNTLILLDGIPVNDPSVISNYFDLNLIATENIERIEVLKGGQSTLYGSDAVTGVINIITRKPANKPFSLNGGMSIGSYNTYKEYINLNGTSKYINWGVDYTTINSAGFSSAYDSTAKKSVDRDGFNQHAVGGNINFKLNNKVQLKLLSGYTYYKTDLDAAAFTDDKDFTAKTNNARAGVGLIVQHTIGSFHFNYLFNYVQRNYLNDSAYKSSPYLDYSKERYTGRTHFAEAYNNWKWNNWELMLGLDYRFNNTDQKYYSTGPYGPPYDPAALIVKMNQTSPYGSIIYKNGKGLTIEAGSRLNFHSVYGSNASFSFNPSFVVKHTMKLFGNLYSAFKTPTLYQLFETSYGNKDLKPENGIIVEAGVELLPTKGFGVRAVGFYRNTKNKIEFIVTDPMTFASQYQNVSRQEDYGAELEAAYQLDKWNIGLNYTYTDGKTKSKFDGTGFPLAKDTTYYNLYRIPKSAFNINLGYQATKQLYTSLNLHVAGKRYEFIYGAAPEELKSYYTIGLYGEYAFGKCKAFVDLRNITDQQYFDILGYNSRKFNFNAGVSFGF